MQDIGFWLLNDIVLAAAALEAANGMTSHSKTCYFVKCFARR